MLSAHTALNLVTDFPRREFASLVNAAEGMETNESR